MLTRSSQLTNAGTVKAVPLNSKSVAPDKNVHATNERLRAKRIASKMSELHELLKQEFPDLRSGFVSKYRVLSAAIAWITAKQGADRALAAVCVADGGGDGAGVAAAAAVAADVPGEDFPWDPEEYDKWWER